jgi:hypothetical protein
MAIPLLLDFSRPFIFKFSNGDIDNWYVYDINYHSIIVRRLDAARRQTDNGRFLRQGTEVQVTKKNPEDSKICLTPAEIIQRSKEKIH